MYKYYLFLVCMSLPSISLNGMELQQFHPLLVLPSDLKVEIISHLFSQNRSAQVANRETGKQIRIFLLASRSLYFDNSLVDTIFEKVARFYSVLPVDVWIAIPTPLSKKYLRSTTYNRMATLIQSILLYHKPIYPPQMNMLLELYPLAQYPDYYKGFEKEMDPSYFK